MKPFALKRAVSTAALPPLAQRRQPLLFFSVVIICLSLFNLFLLALPFVQHAEVSVRTQPPEAVQKSQSRCFFSPTNTPKQIYSLAAILQKFSLFSPDVSSYLTSPSSSSSFVYSEAVSPSSFSAAALVPFVFFPWSSLTASTPLYKRDRHGQLACFASLFLHTYYGFPLSLLREVWRRLRLAFPCISQSIFSVFSSAPLDAAIHAWTLPPPLLLPHILATIATAHPWGVHTPGRGDAHDAASKRFLMETSTVSSHAKEDRDGVQAKRTKENIFSPSSTTSAFHSPLQNCDVNFPDPAPPPERVIELDLATWDLIADVVTAPQQPNEKQRQQQRQQQPHTPKHRQQQQPVASQHPQQSPTTEQEQQQQERCLVSDQEQQRCCSSPQQQEQQHQDEESARISAPVSQEGFVHSPIPTPPRLWLMAFMATGCMHCQRLRPVLQRVQRAYSTQVHHLRRARRQALASLQLKAAATLSQAAAATAAARDNLLRLSGRGTPEVAVRRAEQQAVLLQQEEHALQHKLLLQVSQLYSAAATAAWTYPDVVFAAFDCMQSKEHQFLCEHTLGIFRFPTVLLLRTLPTLASLAAYAAADDSRLHSPPLCFSSRSQKRFPFAAAGGRRSDDTYAATAKGGVDGSADSRVDEEEEGELTFFSSSLLGERRGETQRRYRAVSAAAATAAAHRSLKKEYGREQTALSCGIQEQLLTEFPPFTRPSLQRLLLFLQGSTAEVASWAPVVPPPASLLEHLLHFAAKPTAAAPAASAFGAADSAAYSVATDATAQAGRLQTGAAAAAEGSAEEAKEKAAAAVGVFLEKIHADRNSNGFLSWLSKRIRGEAVRQVVSVEEARQLHYGTSTATAAGSRSNSCSSPAVSFLMCTDLPQILQAERGGGVTHNSSPSLPEQYLQQQHLQQLKQKIQQQRQQQSQPQEQKVQQEERPQPCQIMRRSKGISRPVVRLDGLRAAFETFAAAAAELRVQHLFLYSTDSTTCALLPSLLGDPPSPAGAERKLQLAVKQQQQPHHAAAATAAKIHEEKLAAAERAARGRAAGRTPATENGVGSSRVDGEVRQQQPLRVLALQPGMLFEEEGDEIAAGKDGDECSSGEEAATAATGFSTSGGGRKEGEETAENKQPSENEQKTKRRSVGTKEQRKVMLLQRILKRIWSAQRTVAIQLEQGEEDERGPGSDKGAGIAETDGWYEERKREEKEKCTWEGDAARQQDCCVDLEEGREQHQQQHQKQRDDKCLLYEDETVSAMQLPTFVGPFPYRIDQLSSAASAGGAPAIAARASLFAAVSSPPLASFVDVFRIPTLPLIDEENFLQLRIAGSSSWLLPERRRSRSDRQSNTPSHSNNQFSGATEVGRRQLVVAVLDLRVLDMLLMLFEECQTAAAVDQAVLLQQQAAALAYATAAAADTSAPKATRDGRIAEGDVLEAEAKRTAALVTTALSAPCTTSTASAAEGGAAGLAHDASASTDNTAAASAAWQLAKLVLELWQLSWGAREVLLDSQQGLLQPIRQRKKGSSGGGYASGRTSSHLTVYSSPFLFGILDGFRYSEALADFDVHVNEDEELPAVLAFDPLLPSFSAAGSDSSSSNSCNSSNCGSIVDSSSPVENDRVGSSKSTCSKEGTESCQSDGSSGSSDLREEPAAGAGPGTGEAVEKRKGKMGKRGFVSYYYRDRLRLRLEDLPVGLSLLHTQTLVGRRAQSEEEDDEEISLLNLPEVLLQRFKRVGRRIAVWIRKEYKAASHSRLALLRLTFSLFAFFLILACTTVLLLYTICCPTRESVDDEEQEDDSTIDTAELETEEEEDPAEEEEKEDKEPKRNEETFTTSEQLFKGVDASKCASGIQHSVPRCSLSSSSGTSSSTRPSVEKNIPSVEEVRRRAQKMLRNWR